jgi:hypothetical protein
LYYGEPFPLPFYVKTGDGAFLPGVGPVLSFAQYVLAPLGLLALIGLLRLGRMAVPAAVASGAFLVIFLAPEHLMSYEWRYLYPLVPLFSALAGIGLGAVASWVTAQGVRPGLAAALLVAIATVPAWSFLQDAPGMFRVRNDYADGLEQAHIALSRHLAGFRESRHAEQPLLAIGDAGATPYYSRWRTLDTFGLNDRTIALSGQHDPGYILATRPDLLVLISSAEEDFVPRLPWEQGLYERALQVGMTRIGALVFERESYYLWLMAVPGTPVAQHLEDW